MKLRDREILLFAYFSKHDYDKLLCTNSRLYQNINHRFVENKVSYKKIKTNCWYVFNSFLLPPMQSNR